MDPFMVLGLPVQTTDEAVERRYQELLRRYPPDRSPAEFQAVRRAYEALRDRRRRIDARLFSFDATGRTLSEDQLVLPTPPRPRLPAPELVRLLRQALREQLER